MKAPLSPFLSLMKEKEAKENQGIRDACQVSRVLQTKQRGSCQVACIRPNFVGGRSRLDLLLPSFLLSREEKKRLFLRERRAICQVACIRPNFAGGRSRLDLLLLSFLLSREEKKEPFLRERRDLCQVAGDNYALEKSTRQTARLSIWGFFLMREMKAPLSPFLFLM